MASQYDTILQRPHHFWPASVDLQWAQAERGGGWLGAMSGAAAGGAVGSGGGGEGGERREERGDVKEEGGER